MEAFCESFCRSAMLQPKDVRQAVATAEWKHADHRDVDHWRSGRTKMVMQRDYLRQRSLLVEGGNPFSA